MSNEELVLSWLGIKAHPIKTNEWSNHFLMAVDLDSSISQMIAVGEGLEFHVSN
jgi:hypothetical protein